MRLGASSVCWAANLLLTGGKLRQKQKRRNRYPTDMPLVSANPDTIEEALRGLIEDPERRVRLAYESRQYVEKYHDSLVVARDMMDIYRQVGLPDG